MVVQVDPDVMVPVGRKRDLHAALVHLVVPVGLEVVFHVPVAFLQVLASFLEDDSTQRL